MTITFYHYPACSTCKRAKKFLDAHDVAYRSVHIVENPPDAQELRKAAAALDGGIRKLFNSSGEVYRELNMKERLPSLSEDEAIALLASHGKLVKRPLLVHENGVLVGFDEEEWGRLA